MFSLPTRALLWSLVLWICLNLENLLDCLDSWIIVYGSDKMEKNNAYGLEEDFLLSFIKMGSTSKIISPFLEQQGNTYL